MPNKMHASWLAGKAALESEVAYYKKNGGLIAKPVEDVLKTFTKGFGPALENVGKAYKDKKDADTKKLAKAAITIGDKYMVTLKAMKTGGLTDGRVKAIKLAQTKLEGVLANLKTLEEKGSAAPDVV